MPKFDLLALLTSAVCHDANHDGFTNVYNVKAERPLGILFKNQSVMETHHCEMAIQILTKEVLDIPKHGCINLHGSLLPMYRGAAPINWAIIKGEKKSGNDLPSQTDFRHSAS